MAKALPMNRPVPMAPPMAIMLICAAESRRCRPCSRREMASKPWGRSSGCPLESYWGSYGAEGTSVAMCGCRSRAPVRESGGVRGPPREYRRGPRERGSGHLVPDLVARLFPGFALEDFQQRLHRIPDLDEAGVQRGEAEAQDARLAVVADYPRSIRAWTMA